MRDYKKYAQDLRRIAQFQNCFECYEGERTEGSCSSYCTLNKAADAIEELLDELTTIRKQLPRWISVEDELPEFHMNDSGCVCTRNIVFRTEYKTVHLGYVIRTAHKIETVDGFEQILMDRWYDQTGDMIEGVTHWMPLPTSPGGAE